VIEVIMAAVRSLSRYDRARRHRDFIRRILVEWGEFEAMGRYAAKAQQSIMGRLIEEGPTPPCGEMGPRVPLLAIPWAVSEMSRTLDLMRVSTPGGERYYRVLRLRYATAYHIGGRDRVGNEQDDRIRAAELAISVSRFRHLVGEAVDAVNCLWGE
jgi:hypothetical protein